MACRQRNQPGKRVVSFRVAAAANVTSAQLSILGVPKAVRQDCLATTVGGGRGGICRAGG